MSKGLLPIFIFTPFIGQGDIHNDEWIDGRIALFEAVTKTSISNLLGERTYWVICLGRNPSDKVVKYAESIFGDNPHVHLIFNRFSVDSTIAFAKEFSPAEHYITICIADDDAWPNNYFSTIREKANVLMEKGDYHAGLTFSNGLEWVMCDQVDIDFLNKSGFHIIRKMNLIEYHYEWHGFCYFILQTLTRPFKSMSIAHPKVPGALREQNFSVHVSEEPRRAWLYNRHQLADSSLVKSENQPLKFTLEQLEDEFGIDAEKVAAWPKSRFGSTYCQKHAQGAGVLELYDFPDLSNFVHIPYKYLYLQKGVFRFDPFVDFNITGRSRIRFYNEDTKEYILLMTVEVEKSKQLAFDISMFNKDQRYKFDIQKWNGNSWERIMPFIFLKFEEYLHAEIEPEVFNSIIDLAMVPGVDGKCKLRILNDSKKEYFFDLFLDGKNLVQSKFNNSLLNEDDEFSYRLYNQVEGKWELIHIGAV
jgi:hypothetical protein